MLEVACTTPERLRDVVELLATASTEAAKLGAGHVSVRQIDLGPSGPELPGLVRYRGKLGLQTMRTAVVTATMETLDPRGVERGDVPGLDSSNHVHLWVYTPADRPGGGFPEFNVPYAEPDESGTIPPGTWSHA